MDNLENKIEINDENNNQENNKDISTKSENNTLNQSHKFHININPKNFENEEYSNLNHQHHHNHNESCKCQIHKKNTFGNIGINYVLFKKYVFGPLIHIWLWLFCASITFFGWLIWLYSVGDYYPKKLYYFLDVLCVITEYYLILSYITEPGIIPRKCPEFAPNDIDNSEETNKIKEEDKEKPRIYTKRKCPTCNIIRPSGASHCHICDNCVLEFDHHCVFISNCVGKRNHKYFVLFLIWGGLFALICTILVLKVMYSVLVTNSKETISLIYHGSPFPFIICVILLILGLKSLFNASFQNYFYAIIYALISFFIFFIIWKQNIDSKKVPSYYNPYLFLALGIALGLALFIIGNLSTQLYFISKGVTMKQEKSIQDKVREFNQIDKEQSEYINDYLKSPSCKERLINIFKFLFAKIDKSLIIPERDLILIKS